MKAELGLTTFTEGVVTSSLLFAAAIGATVTGTLADRIGRRKVLLILSWVFILGTTTCVLVLPHCPRKNGAGCHAGCTLTPDEIKKAWKDAKKSGEAEGKRRQEEIRRNADKG